MNTIQPNTKIASVQNEKAAFVVVNPVDLDSLPSLRAELQSRGWDGAAMIRRANGKRQYYAYYTRKYADIHAVIVA